MYISFDTNLSVKACFKTRLKDWHKSGHAAHGTLFIPVGSVKLNKLNIRRLHVLMFVLDGEINHSQKFIKQHWWSPLLEDEAHDWTRILAERWRHHSGPIRAQSMGTCNGGQALARTFKKGLFCDYFVERLEDYFSFLSKARGRQLNMATRCCIVWLM